MIACEVDNGEDIFFIMRRHKDRFLQDKASCRTSLTPKSEVLLFFSYRVGLEDVTTRRKKQGIQGERGAWVGAWGEIVV